MKAPVRLPARKTKVAQKKRRDAYSDFIHRTHQEVKSFVFTPVLDKEKKSCICHGLCCKDVHWFKGCERWTLGLDGGGHQTHHRSNPCPSSLSQSPCSAVVPGAVGALQQTGRAGCPRRVLLGLVALEASRISKTSRRRRITPRGLSAALALVLGRTRTRAAA